MTINYGDFVDLFNFICKKDEKIGEYYFNFFRHVRDSEFFEEFDSHFEYFELFKCSLTEELSFLLKLIAGSEEKNKGVYVKFVFGDSKNLIAEILYSEITNKIAEPYISANDENFRDNYFNQLVSVLYEKDGLKQGKKDKELNDDERNSQWYLFLECIKIIFRDISKIVFNS